MEKSRPANSHVLKTRLVSLIAPSILKIQANVVDLTRSINLFCVSRSRPAVVRKGHLLSI